MALAQSVSDLVGQTLGQSEAFLDFQDRLSRAAQVDRPVLIVGERGSGKELAAARLHYLSPRWKERYQALNCAALAPSLIESELFGHEAGAFTGADRRRLGRFEATHKGTLLLDEVGLIPMQVQEKILRVVEYGSLERVGGSEPVQVDVRLIGATNADLKELTGQGRFKQDLLDRLSFEVLYLPPLRERQEDILLLANHFAARMAFELGRQETPRLSEEAARKLLDYDWPGNIRELKNVVERAVYRSEEVLVEEVVFDPFRPRAAPAPAAESEIRSEPPPAPREKPVEPAPTLPQAVQDLEVRLLDRALARARFNQKEAAQLLGLTYHQFRGLFRKHRDRLEA